MRTARDNPSILWTSECVPSVTMQLMQLWSRPGKGELIRIWMKKLMYSYSPRYANHMHCEECALWRTRCGDVVERIRCYSNSVANYKRVFFFGIA